MTTMGKLVKALFTRVRANAPLMASVTGVFDTVPEGQAMPYITLTDITEDPKYMLAGEKGWETSITLYVWSQSTNNLEQFDILELLETALDAPLELEGYVVADQRFKTSTTERQSNYLRYLPITINFKVEVA